MKYRILKHSKAPYDKVHEECGVFGVYAPETTDVAAGKADLGRA